MKIHLISDKVLSRFAAWACPAVAALALLSCTEMEKPLFPTKQDVPGTEGVAELGKVKVVVEAKGSATRTACDAAGKISWDEHDRLALLEVKNDTTLVQIVRTEARPEISGDGATARFTAFLSPVDGESFSYMAVFPDTNFIRPAKVDVGYFLLKIPPVQTPVKESFDPCADLMVSTLTEKRLRPEDEGTLPIEMKRPAAIARLALKGIPAGETFRDMSLAASGDPICGQFYYDLDYGMATPRAGAPKTLTLNLKRLDKSEAGQETGIYCVLLPQTLPAYTVTLHTDKAAYTMEGRDLSLEAGRLTELPWTVQESQRREVLTIRDLTERYLASGQESWTVPGSALTEGYLLRGKKGGFNKVVLTENSELPHSALLVERSGGLPSGYRVRIDLTGAKIDRTGGMPILHNVKNSVQQIMTPPVTFSPIKSTAEKLHGGDYMAQYVAIQATSGGRGWWDGTAAAFEDAAGTAFTVTAAFKTPYRPVSGTVSGIAGPDGQLYPLALSDVLDFEDVVFELGECRAISGRGSEDWVLSFTSFGMSDQDIHVASDQPWLVFTGVSDGGIHFTAAPNKDKQHSRTATVTITTPASPEPIQVLVTQEKASSGGIEVGTVLWSEDWSGLELIREEDNKPLSYYKEHGSGTGGLYKNDVRYSSADDKAVVKTWGSARAQKFAGGEPPELMVNAKTGTFLIEGIPVAGVKKLQLIYRTNRHEPDKNIYISVFAAFDAGGLTQLETSAPGPDLTEVGADGTAGREVTAFIAVPKGAKSLRIEYRAGDKPGRIDDLELKVAEVN